MTRWKNDAREFTVSVTHNARSTSSYSNIPKPVLKRLGNPKRITFTMHDGFITVDTSKDLE